MYSRCCLTFLVSSIVAIAASCGKSNSVTCTNPDATNYNHPGTCLYPKDSILAVGGYRLVVAKYPLQPSLEGTTFGMIVERQACANLTDSFYKIIELDWQNGLFQPYSYCVTLNGFSFTIPPGTNNFTWSGATVTGTGTFSGKSFQFTGIVHSSGGDSAIVINSF